MYLVTYSFSKNVDLTEKNVDFSVKTVIVLSTIFFPHCTVHAKEF